MRALFLVSTVLFWIVVAAAWVSALRPLAPAPSDVSAEPRYVLADIAQHGSVDDCWMAIDGVVYDFTAYLPQHPTSPRVMAAWCGKEASEAYHTKTRGRPHSSYADGLLPAWRVGVLAAEP